MGYTCIDTPGFPSKGQRFRPGCLAYVSRVTRDMRQLYHNTLSVIHDKLTK